MRRPNQLLPLGVAAAWLAAPASAASPAATLPVPCIGSVCANSAFGATQFVSSGRATATRVGAQLTVNQTSTSATLNWQSFNISADGKVQFVQPSATAVALNQIADSNATQILGSLNANGRVFLINQNGIIFGQGAQVNVGGLVASTLNISPTAASNGLAYFDPTKSSPPPAFQSFASGASGPVDVASGATLQTTNGGQILIFAPEITNEGTISTPAGQTVLAAGNTIYLAASGDSNLRGLLVAVGGTGGTVTNGNAGNASATSPEQLVGQIVAQLGNVTLAGLAVNQLGRVSATTSISENGSVILRAGNQSLSTGENTAASLHLEKGGNLKLGANSDTEVTLDSADPSTTVDSVAQPKSSIEMDGANIQMLQGSVARATGGSIAIRAALDPNANSTSVSDGSRFYLAPGAELDVSGASTTLPVSSNVIPVQLRGVELADSPLQQNGPLRSQTVYVDIRQGTPLADVSGEIAAIGHNVVERNLSGGTITLQSHGDAILAPASVVDVAGGQIDYTAGYLNTSKLLTATGQIVDIGSASPNVIYQGIVTSSTVSDLKWGVSNTYALTQGTYSAGYVEGKDAGTLAISAPQFVLDSTAHAGTVAGLYQRSPDTTVPANFLYRAYDQVPLPATLVIGSTTGDFTVGSVTIGGAPVLPGLANSDGSAFNPLNDPLPASYSASILRASLLGTQGFGNVTILTDGEYLQPAAYKLALPAGGSFSVAAKLIDVEGGIDVPGGAITFAAQPTSNQAPFMGDSLIIGPGAALTARGAWVNDNPLLYPDGNPAPLFINGGSISLVTTEAPGMMLAPGSLIDVSAGAQLTGAGKLNPGVGGKITLGAETSASDIAPTPLALSLGAILRGDAMYDGGTLSLISSSVCISSANCSGGDPNTLWVSPAQLSQGGFADYQLSAQQGGLSVAPGTTITLQQQNFMLPTQARFLANQPTLEGSAAITTLTDQLRQPVSLTLTQAVPATGQAGSVNVLDVTGLPSLVINPGVVIQGDPGASIALSSNVRILEEGTLRAPGGTISLNLDASIAEQMFSGTQAIWLGSEAVLDTAGVAQIYPNSIGQPTGGVLPGGTVSFTANRGYVELAPGSLVDLAGTSGRVDAIPAGGGPARLEQVASAGGSLQLSAAEGISMGGLIEAQAGTPGPGLPQPAGGTFSLVLDGNARGDSALTGAGGASTFPSAPRQIIVSNTQPQVVSPGAPVPDADSGKAFVSPGALAAAGFDTVSLRAAFLNAVVNNGGPNGTPVAENIPGNIDFVGNMSLNAGRLLSLDAATYSVTPGGKAAVESPYIEIGNSDILNAGLVPAATPGTGELDVISGSPTVTGFIELYGVSALEGIGNTQFTSSGDLRLLGLLGEGTSFNGELQAAGNIRLTSQQLYPATLTQFVISADPHSVASPLTGLIEIAGQAGSRTDLLSAGGAVTLSAGTVSQQGIVRAPLGSINIDAQTITLGPGSVTSTSTDGITIPFGTTQGGIDWVYPLTNGNQVVYGTDGIAPPAQRVTLQGANVTVRKGATIDVSGGGDLQAYEWIFGTGGTNDVLSNSADPIVGGRPTQFAILPGLNANVAPYDPNIWSSLSPQQPLNIGESVYLAGTTGLPAGVYQLLPARYALLPGAFLVTEVTGYTDIQPGQAIPVLGGGSIIAGYQTVANTDFGDSRTNGFQVVPASVVLQQAQYTLTSANAFFADQANSQASSAPRLPRDSGVLALAASDSLTLEAGLSLRTTPGTDGLGAEVDVASADILVSSGAQALAGELVVNPAALSALGAQTLLLGGTLNEGSIATTASTVEFGAGAALTAPTILAVAQNQITLDSGATLTAAGAAPGGVNYTLSGDGALLAASAGSLGTVTRTGSTGAAGVLTLASGSTVNTKGGSLYLEASNNVVTDGALSLSGGDLAVASPDIVLGAPPATVTGTVLGSNILNAPGLRTLLLASGGSIDVYGSVALNTASITVDAPGFSGFGAPGDAATLSGSKTFTLENSENSTASSTGTGTGSLTISAPAINLAGGSFAVTGFASTMLEASKSLTATPLPSVGGSSSATSISAPAPVSSTLTTAGALDVTTSEITTGADSSLSLTAGGAVSVVAPAKVAAAAGGALGGALTITGASIDLGTQIELPSGRVLLSTTGVSSNGELNVLSGSVINVAGVVQQYDGVSVASPGGMVTLESAGNIALAPGSAINVSAGSVGQGGGLAISAPSGTATVSGLLTGTGGTGTGASFRIDAESFGAPTGFAALNQLLGSGFSGGRSIRLRGPGDLDVATGTMIIANSVSLEADQGNIHVEGTIDANAPNGGAVTLTASGDVIVGGSGPGSLLARATGAGETGGTVQLETTGGQVLLEQGSMIDVSGGGASANGVGGGGQVLLRVPSQNVLTLLNSSGGGVAMNGSIVGAVRTTLEAFEVTANQTGMISQDDPQVQAAYTDAQNFMNNAGTITAALGQAQNAAFVLEPGVEIDATVASNGSGTLTLPAGSDWNLYDWRFGPNGVPGILTLRAQNGISFQGSLSDGFATSRTDTLPSTASDSWSYRIVAGADLSAANPLAVNAASRSPVNPNPPDVSIASMTLVRTGDGFIDVSAAGDFTLADQTSVLYTAGYANSNGILLPGRVGTLQGRAYPIGGGNISIDVGGDVNGAPTDQFVNAWLWRVGSAEISSGSATAWTVNFGSFQQGIGALGGGNITVRAGGNITDFSASIPTIGVPLGGTTFADNVLEVTGGGNLDVVAGESISGGSYYSGQGSISLTAGNDVTASASQGLAPIIGLGNASFSVTAGGNLALAEIVNPTLLNRGLSQGNSTTSPVVYFSTYGPRSAVNLMAVGGNVVLSEDDSTVETALGASFSGGLDSSGSDVLDTLPPALNVMALSGDVEVDRTLSLLPSPSGNLQIFANQNVVGTGRTSAAQLIVSDADPALLPTPTTPGRASSLQILADIASALVAPASDTHAAIPVDQAVDQSGQVQPVRVVALNGSVLFDSENTSGIWSAKPVQVSSGLDVVDLNLVAQNLSGADVTSVTAGRDFLYPQSRNAVGTIAADTNGVSVDGPGELDISAGRNVNLGTSAGIISRANLVNPVLPALGASISVQAGVATGAAQYSAFINQYIVGSSQFDPDVIAFVESVEDVAGLTAAQAKQALAAMSAGLQRTFVEQTFFELLKVYGSAEAASGNGDFSGAFAAIEKLFPGASKVGSANPYAGDIDLYFSQIYTYQGGNISLLAPGGELNVGLSEAPASFGINKAPDQLGIVAKTSGDVDSFSYGDFQVNQSRVFAADGGDILVWSTQGNIDAGRGSKTSISAPELNIVYDDNGQPTVSLRAAIAGSGIQALAGTPGVTPGNVYLFAPHGVVNADDAGIVAGNLTVAATAVLGANNITVSGTTVGVPVTVTGLGNTFSGAASTAGAASNVAENFAPPTGAAASALAADTALGWLEVFVTGLGEANCKPDDLECLKREELNKKPQ